MASASSNCLSVPAVCVTLLLCLHLSPTRAELKTCYKDESLGNKEGNTYLCGSDPESPECCIQDSAPTCCEPASTATLKQQLQLWGTVGAVILIAGLLLFCFRKDINYCTSDKPLTEKIRNKLNKRKAAKQGEVTGFTRMEDSEVSKSRPGSGYTNDDSGCSSPSAPKSASGRR